MFWLAGGSASGSGEGKRSKQGTGVEMAKKTWGFNIENKRHTVEVEWSRWSGRGKILVDGKITDIWGKGLMQLPSEKHLEVANKPAVIRRKGRIFEVPELYVDGELIP